MNAKGRVMAFDYGLKRTGIAVSDDQRIFAFPLETVETGNIMNWLSEYLKNETISLFVVGLPLCKDETPAAIEPHIGGFVSRLKKQYPEISIERQDERYTSKMAMDSMISGGVPKMKRRDKSLVDKISAAIILQSYFEMKNQ